MPHLCWKLVLESSIILWWVVYFFQVEYLKAVMLLLIGYPGFLILLPQIDYVQHKLSQLFVG